MKTIFTLTSARSGTRFLADLYKENILASVVYHEPYFAPGNPTMFGLPIYDHSSGNLEPVKELLQTKARSIGRYAPRVYIETSHAFLKSYWDLATEFFLNVSVVHLVRNPLQVARSEVNREILIDRWRFPFRRYRGRDDRKYFLWSLTGLEPIFHFFDPNCLTRFQWYFIQWIEIENRAFEFLERFGKRSMCFTLHSPIDLTDRDKIAELFLFQGLKSRTVTPIIRGSKNRTPGQATTVGSAEEVEVREVIQQIPEKYLRIFRDKPYSDFEWVSWLQK